MAGSARAGGNGAPRTIVIASSASDEAIHLGLHAMRDVARTGDISGIRSGTGAGDGMRRRRQTEIRRRHAARSARRAGAADCGSRRQSQRPTDAVLRSRPRPCEGADAKAGRRAGPACRPAVTDQGPVPCRGRKDHISVRSDIAVERLEDNGAVIYAKSNTPEFGAGANTFNEVFGATLNPWDLSRSAAGSSGGAAVALATGMAWLAQGTDMGGSLRNPASFCGVVGMRPSIGRVAHTPTFKIDRNLTVHGPMARNIEDTALLLGAMSGEYPAW